MLLDTSAWIEFFIKGEKGQRVLECLKNESCFTCISSLAEISNWAMKQNISSESLVRHVISLSEIIEMSENLSVLSGELNFMRKKIKNDWGMMDTFILAASQTYGLKIITKDAHFRDLPNAVML